MIRIGVTLRTLTLPYGLAESCLMAAVKRAVSEYNRALEGLVSFELSSWPTADCVVFVEFGRAALKVAELEVHKENRSFTLRLDPRADWDLKRRWFMRFGSVSAETFLMHEMAHIAQFAHEDDPDSILFSHPFPRRRLTGEDVGLLRRIFGQWAATQQTKETNGL